MECFECILELNEYEMSTDLFINFVDRSTAQCETRSVIITSLLSLHLCPHFLKYECSMLDVNLKANIFQQRKKRVYGRGTQQS